MKEFVCFCCSNSKVTLRYKLDKLFFYLGRDWFVIPKGSLTLGRMLYHYAGDKVLVENNELSVEYFAELNGNEDIHLKNGNAKCKLLLMEGEPIGEPVAAHGPFVMNTVGELKEAFDDYQKTQFGGWPWEREDPVNARSSDRFADYEHGKRIEKPKGDSI